VAAHPLAEEPRDKVTDSAASSRDAASIDQSSDQGRRMPGWLPRRALLAVISAIAHGVFLAVLGLPNATALGIWFGVIASFIPIIGTYVAGVLPISGSASIRGVSARLRPRRIRRDR
jgi:predicted PurR-regulated permease PerM